MTKLRWNDAATLYQAIGNQPDDHRFAEYVDIAPLAELVGRVARQPAEARCRLSIVVPGHDRMLHAEIVNLSKRPDFPKR